MSARCVTLVCWNVSQHSISPSTFRFRPRCFILQAVHGQQGHQVRVAHHCDGPQTEKRSFVNCCGLDGPWRAGRLGRLGYLLASCHPIISMRKPGVQWMSFIDFRIWASGQSGFLLAEGACLRHQSNTLCFWVWRAMWTGKTNKSQEFPPQDSLPPEVDVGDSFFLNISEAVSNRSKAAWSTLQAPEGHISTRVKRLDLCSVNSVISGLHWTLPEVLAPRTNF